MNSATAARRRRPLSTTHRRGLLRILAAGWLLGLGWLVHADDAPVITPEQRELFEKQIRPLLVEQCYGCHSSTAQKVRGGLRLDSREAMLAGGDLGPAIEPGDAGSSLLIEAVRYQTMQMPPTGRLNEQQVEALITWVNQGAPWPGEPAKSSPSPGSSSLETFDLQKRKAEHWAWQPIEAPDLPPIADSSWPRQDWDRFIRAGLEAEDLEPAPDVDRASLARRLSFDLTGLPLSIEQRAAYLADPSEAATEKLVDALLDSPHFGERWARHWMDLVRYAESRGHEFDMDASNAFQYRDYLIRAFNADLPYDQFVREQIAGDLLERPRTHPERGFNESILGTGIWFLGEWVHSPVDTFKDEADRFDNMIDVMSKTFLGMTVSCARCHDHKFDAISTADYYALTGFLQSSDHRQVRFETIEQNRQVADDLARLDTISRAEVTERLIGSGCDLATLQIPALDADLANHLVIDYASVNQDHWRQDGFLFGSGPRGYGEPLIEVVDGKPQIRWTTLAGASADRFWNGLQSTSQRGIQVRGRLARLPRSGRTLISPTFALTDGRLSCRVKGSGAIFACVDSHRLIAGPLHGETVKEFKEVDGWVTLELNRYAGHRIHLEITPATDAALTVAMIVQGTSDAMLARLDERQRQIEREVTRFASMADSLLPDDLAERWAEARTELQGRVRHRSALAMAMIDQSGEEGRILVRGNASRPGEQVPRRFLSALSGEDPMPIDSGSGRLQLAAAINDRDNPLTHRVIVNRVWHHLMGRGIVPTTDDLGVLGQRPTHPQLLDALVISFRQSGQSLKALIREIVLSRTYQMSDRADPRAPVIDPKNRLWSHRPAKRLEAEAIRDTLLALSGRLDRTMYGDSVPIHLTSFLEGRGRPGVQGPLDGEGRRSIYLAVRRNFLSPFLLTFDMPVPFSTMGRRNRSNVPAQALVLMNDPMVLEQAGLWAERIVAGEPTETGRIETMYKMALGRGPSERERRAVLEYLDRGEDRRSSWSHLAQALINTKEFLYLK